MKPKRKKSLVGWIGDCWEENFKLSKSLSEYNKESIVTRYKMDISDVKVRITIEEL